jgi:hypothetical protein
MKNTSTSETIDRVKTEKNRSWRDAEQREKNRSWREDSVPHHNRTESSKRSIPVKSKIELSEDEENDEQIENIVNDSSQQKERKDETKNQIKDSQPNKTNIYLKIDSVIV